MDKDLQTEEKSLTDDIANLTKKVHIFFTKTDACVDSDPLCKAKYLEKQFNDAQAQLRDIVGYPSFVLMFANLLYLHLQFHNAPK